MTVTYLDIETRMHTTFSSDDQTWVNAVIAKMRISFANDLGSAPVESDAADAEILELMTVLAVAKADWGAGHFAASIQSPDGTNYQFSTKMIRDIEDELDEKIENAGYTSPSITTSSFNYGW